MAQKTDAQLLAQAQVIKNETIDEANTTTRVGAMLEDFADSKANNSLIVKKIYAAAFTQSSGSAPTIVTLFANQLSAAIVWTRQSTGTYIGTLAGAFLANKVPTQDGFIRFGSNLGSTILNTYTIQRLTDNTIAIGTFQNGVLADGLLTNQYFEISVFN